MFYTDAKSCITNNGYMSNYFPINRGVRQGCPLSPYLFVICIELLSHKIGSADGLQGISLSGKEFRKSLFADDATFILNGSSKSFEILINILDTFANISGLKLNAKKCQVLRIGSLVNSEVIYLKKRKFQWSSATATALGMTFITNQNSIFQANLEPKIIDFENCLKQWQHRKLTLMGKITVIKSFALPKLIYVLSSLQTPPIDTIKRIEKIMYTFIWEGKPDKIKRKILIQEYEKGGLKMIELKTFIKSLKISWIKRILETAETSMFSQIYLSKLKHYGGKLFFRCNFAEKEVHKINIKNKFFKDVLMAWCSENSKTNICNYGNEILWNNTNIKADNNTLVYTDWCNKGIVYFKDIVNTTDKTIHAFNTLREKYNLSNNDFLKYLTLLHSIPIAWKTNIKQENLDTPIPPTLISQILKAQQTNRFIYKNI